MEKLGRVDGAIAAFERYLHAAPAAPDRATVELRLTDLRARQLSAPTPAPVEHRERPVWRSGWFWGVLGGAVAVAVASVTVGVVLGRGDHARTLPDVRPQ